MTVRELIATLQQLDQDLPVYYADVDSHDHDEVTQFNIEEATQVFPKRVVLL